MWVAMAWLAASLAVGDTVPAAGASPMGGPSSAAVVEGARAVAWARLDPMLAPGVGLAVGDRPRLALRPPAGPSENETRLGTAVPPDLAIARWSREAGIQRSAPVRAVAHATGLLAFPGAPLLAAALFGIGELDDRPALARTGRRTGEAIVLAGGVAGASKLITGRTRPYASPDDPYSFSFGRGFTGDAHQSFPSAHTAIAFATAVALSDQVAENHPEVASWVPPVSYTVATLAGLSRVFRDQHWASDIVVGGLVGAASGWIVTR